MPPKTHSEALPIRIRGVSKTYGPVCALQRMDLDIRAGEFLTLLGPSGSGKTTLLMILAGFIRPDCGSVCFGEREVILEPPHRRGVGMVFQNYALFPHMDVAANVAYPLKLRRVAAEERRHRVHEALAMVQLSGMEGRRIDELSGGQKQRVALARAIVFAPRILLMDEPLSALDKQLREQMQLELRQLHERLGQTTVYVTHDQREALTMSDRVAVINEGQLMQLDSPQHIYDRPLNSFIADFIGESVLLPVQVQDAQVRRGETVIAVDGPPPADGAYYLLLRPERLRILDPAAIEARRQEGHNIFSGTAGPSTYQGDSILLQVELDDATTIRVRHEIDQRRAEGETIHLCLARDHTALVPAE